MDGQGGERAAGAASSSGVRVAGLRELCGRALEDELAGAGAVHVDELTEGDWQGLTYWQQMRPFEQRRLLQHR